MQMYVTRPRPADAPEDESRLATAGTPVILARPSQRAAPTVSVVIAAYNAEAFIAEAVASVFAQSLKDLEIIVVDDGSTDRTADIVEGIDDDRLRLIRQRHSGVSVARNTGLAAVRAPFVFFLDADDILAPDALRRMAATLTDMPTRVACFGHHIKIAEDGSELSTRSHVRLKQLPADETLRHLVAKNFICGAICVRTDAARAIGGFDPDLRLGEDWDFWCRLALRGDFAPVLDTVILLYRQRFGSANYQLRPSLWRPDYRALDVIYSNPEIRRRFSSRELDRLRRLAEIDMYWTGARNEYLRGHRLGLVKYLALGAIRYPDSIFRPRLVYLFFRGLKLRNRPDVAAKRAAAPAASAAASGCLFLLTQSREACAVENFAQKLVVELNARYPDGGYRMLAVSGRWRDLPSTLRRIAGAERIVFNLPLVAWKRTLAIPVIIAVFAAMIRRPVHVFLHEWKGLHPLRRIALAPIVWSSRTVIAVSPFVAEQIAADQWLFGAGLKCRLVPHPPTIERPPERYFTDRVERVRDAAANSDFVIGYFGTIYAGKAATSLLGICKNLNDRGVRCTVVFVGGFVRSLDNYEQEFWSEVGRLGIGKHVIVTGYVTSEAELYSLFEHISAFLFLFPEGLTARRSSVIACLQSDRPIIVTAPRSTAEFVHHEGFRALIDAGAFSFVPANADLGAIADRLLATAGQRSGTARTIDIRAWWDAATAAAHVALADDNRLTPDGQAQATTAKIVVPR
jgi:glycosyltransferase involved in cell wall biosynthesis